MSFILFVVGGKLHCPFVSFVQYCSSQLPQYFHSLFHQSIQVVPLFSLMVKDPQTNKNIPSKFNFTAKKYFFHKLFFFRLLLFFFSSFFRQQQHHQNQKKTWYYSSMCVSCLGTTLLFSLCKEWQAFVHGEVSNGSGSVASGVVSSSSLPKLKSSSPLKLSRARDSSTPHQSARKLRMCRHESWIFGSFFYLFQFCWQFGSFCFVSSHFFFVKFSSPFKSSKTPANYLTRTKDGKFLNSPIVLNHTGGRLLH